MYTSAIAKEITVRDIDRSCKNLHGNEKKTWEKNQYIYKMYYFADKQNIQMQKGSSPYGWSNVAVDMPTFTPRWANVSNPTVGLIWLAQCWHDV
jgi:hypothetical protein